MNLVAFDTETHLIQPGLLAPPLVCGSVATAKAGSERTLSADDARRVFRSTLESGASLGGANLVYDLGVMAVDDPSLLPLIFRALEEGRLYSTDILEALHDNARGLMFREANGTPFGRYSLAQLEARYTGVDRSAEKVDGWRYRYAELDGVPLEQWPDEAVSYPRRDARGTLDVLAVQLGEGRHNLQCSTLEMRAAWFLQLACIQGMRTDPLMVPEVVARIRKEHEESRRRFFDEGIVRVRPCATKDGVLERADAIDNEWLQRAAIRLHSQFRSKRAPWMLERLTDIEVAQKALARGRPIRFAEDKKRLAALVEDAYWGDPPLTDGGASGNRKTSTSRDTLEESGMALLEEYGEAGPNEKLLSTYVDVLEQGTRVPINPSANTLVSTQRTSYRLPNLQQLPRKGGVRECFVPRPGWLYCSVDYAALELCTLAQVCLNLFGASEMAKAINLGQDLHTRLAARIAGISYEEAMVRRAAKDPLILALRQTAKPVNFGLPGLMGPPKLVLTARKDGVRFCELAGEAASCSANPKVTTYAHRAISPTCSLCLKLAIKYKELWAAEWPEMVEYHKCTIAQAEECADGFPLESFGQGMKRLEMNANAVSNHFFQNLAAQGAKHAGWLLAKESYTNKSSVLYGNFRTVVFVHDEVIAEVREEAAHEVAQRQAEIMVGAMREFVPDVKISAEPALMRRWFKGADKALTQDGRLRPWWPVGWGWGPDQEQMAKDLAT